MAHDGSPLSTQQPSPPWKSFFFCVSDTSPSLAGTPRNNGLHPFACNSLNCYSMPPNNLPPPLYIYIYIFFCRVFKGFTAHSTPASHNLFPFYIELETFCASAYQSYASVAHNSDVPVKYDWHIPARLFLKANVRLHMQDMSCHNGHGLIENEEVVIQSMTCVVLHISRIG